MNGSTLYAATKEKIFVYTLKGMVLLAKIDAENHMGRIELSPNSKSHPFLIFSNSYNEGNLRIYDTNRLEERNEIRCHRSTILKVCISYDG